LCPLPRDGGASAWRNPPSHLAIAAPLPAANVRPQRPAAANAGSNPTPSIPRAAMWPIEQPPSAWGGRRCPSSLHVLKRHDEAFAAYDKALAREPDLAEARSISTLLEHGADRIPRIDNTADSVPCFERSERGTPVSAVGIGLGGARSLARIKRMVQAARAVRTPEVQIATEDRMAVTAAGRGAEPEGTRTNDAECRGHD
jgi:hypothetical protein